MLPCRGGVHPYFPLDPAWYGAQEARTETEKTRALPHTPKTLSAAAELRLNHLQHVWAVQSVYTREDACTDEKTMADGEFKELRL